MLLICIARGLPHVRGVGFERVRRCVSSGVERELLLVVVGAGRARLPTTSFAILELLMQVNRVEAATIVYRGVMTLLLLLLLLVYQLELLILLCQELWQSRGLGQLSCLQLLLYN